MRQNMKQSWISCCCQETADPRVLCIDLRGDSQESDTGDWTRAVSGEQERSRYGSNLQNFQVRGSN